MCISRKWQPTPDLSGYDVLIVGKEALTPDGPGPDVSRVRDGLKVVLFEQTAKVLEQSLRFSSRGVRVTASVPARSGQSAAGRPGDADHLHDWRGEATLLPPRLQYTTRPRYGPTVQWCGIDVTRAWRCGCRGNVASVLIEKPARGDFLPILDGGYDLQYSPCWNIARAREWSCSARWTSPAAPRAIRRRTH